MKEVGISVISYQLKFGQFLSYQIKSQPISQPSVYLTDIRSVLSVKKCVIFQLIVKILTILSYQLIPIQDPRITKMRVMYRAHIDISFITEVVTLDKYFQLSLLCNKEFIT